MSPQLAVSACWHCHTPLNYTAPGFHNACRSEAIAECPSCGSSYRIIAAMQALTGPAVATFEVAVNDLKSAPLSRFEPQPRGVR